MTAAELQLILRADARKGHTARLGAPVIPNVPAKPIAPVVPAPRS